MNDPTQAASIAETQRRDFESRWLAGAPREIESVIASVPESKRLDTLEELIHIEMEFAWQHRQLEADFDPTPFMVECYLNRFPQLSDQENVIRLLRQEFSVRHQFGDQPTYESYTARFPELIPSVDVAKKRLGKIKQAQTKWNAGDLIDRYRLVQRHGKGGFGEVWRALDTKFDREVAIKRLSRSLASKEDYRKRFTSEAAITACLEHPGIVSVHDAMIAEGDIPIYIMRFLDGETMREAIVQLHNGKKVALIEIHRLLERFCTVCQTVAFAHTAGVIHRDLKPQNIVLAPFGETVVLDWGLAKRFTTKSNTCHDDSPRQIPLGDSSLDPYATQHGTVLGTPHYMSPEQASGSIDEIDTSSDVYSLGVILAEILNGPPRNNRNPGTETSQTPVGSGNRPLLAISQKATALDPGDRYRDANELVSDLERFFADEQVPVYQESMIEAVLRWIRNHPSISTATVVATAASMILLTAVSVVMIQSNRQLSISETKANRHRVIAEQHLESATERLYFQRVLLARNEIENNNITRAKELLNACPIELREWEWFHLDAICEIGSPNAFVPPTDAPLRCAVFDQSGTRIAIADRAGNVFICNAENFQQIVQFGFGGLPRELLFSADDEVLFVGGTINKQGVIKGWDREGQLELEIDAHSRAIGAIALSNDGKWFASGGADHRIKCWSTASWQEAQVFTGHRRSVTSLAFSPDAKMILSASQDRTAKLWDRNSGDCIRTFDSHDEEVHCVAFHSSGERFATAGHDNVIRVFDVSQSDPKTELRGHDHYVRQIDFQPHGKLLASASFDRTARLWHPSSEEPVAILRGHDSHLKWVGFSPDGSRLLTASEDQSVRIWKVDPKWSRPSSMGSMIAYESSGRWLAVGFDREVRVLNPLTMETQFRHRYEHSISEVMVSNSGILAVGFGAGSIELIDITNSKPLGTIQVGSPVLSIAFAEHPSIDLVSASLDGKLSAWTTASLKPVWSQNAHPGGTTCVVAEPSSGLIISSGLDHQAKLWDLGSGNHQISLKGHSGTVARVTISPLGNRIATASFDGSIGIWDRRGKRVKTLNVGNQWINALTFNPDGTRLASGSEESVKVWDTSRWEEVMSLSGHQCIDEMQFSADGNTIALGGRHRGLRFLRSAPND